MKLVEKTSPFWLRYPDQYVKDEGRQLIWPSGYLSNDHDHYIKECYFEFLGSCGRYPRYTNKRGIDPQVQCFMDEQEIQYEKTWDLPFPNQQAAYISLSKYGKAEVLMTSDRVVDLNKAWEWTMRQFLPYMSGARIVSLEEAIAHLDLSTSSGAPFNFRYKTKKELFDMDPNITEWLKQDWENLANYDWTCIFSSSLKEELRPLEKIAQNSIRTFTAGPVDATVHGTRLFVDMNERLYDSHLKSASTVGMSPLGGNWHKLYQKLNVFPNGYALDESQYDSSLRAFLMSGCAKLRWLMLDNEYQTPENLIRVKTYYRNLTHTLIMTAEGNLIFKKLGNPSGSVNTVSDNTIILYWMLAFAWIRTAPKDVCTYTDFELNTAKCLLGDDNTWTVSDFAHEFYSAKTVIEEWKYLGITTTTDSMEARPAVELDFLSAHTVFLKGYAVPLYDRNKLMQSLLYAPKKQLTPETSLQRVNNLLQIGWTDLPFRKFCREFIAWLLWKYDDVLKDDTRWIIAKSQIWTDEQHFQLFTGKKLVLHPQGYQEVQERSNKPDKRNFMNSAPQKKQTKNPRRRNRRGGAKRKSQPQVAQGPKPQPRRNPRRRRGGRGRNTGMRPQGNNQRADTSAKYGGAPMITNTRKISKPEPFSGDELIATLNGSVGFATTQFSLNPGNPTTFPWFNKIASLYERYKFTMLEFYFQHDVSQFNAQGAAGLVILSALYDAASSAPTSKTQIEATDPHVICMPNENACLKLAVQGMHPVGEPKFVRGLSLPGATDIKTYDAGSLFATTQGMAGATEVGELHVRYRGLLYDRILDASAAVAPQNFSVSQFSNTAQASANATPTTMLLATVVANGLAAVNTAGSIVLPAGNYLVSAQAELGETGGLIATAIVALTFSSGGTTVTAENQYGGGTNTLMSISIAPQFFISNGTNTISLVTTITATLPTAACSLTIMAI